MTRITDISASNRSRTVADLGDAIAELSACIDAATYRLLVLIREFDEREGWYDGFGPRAFKSCAHWLNWRTGVALGAAREKVRVARALGDLPRIGASMERGELSYSKVRALTRVATRENEAELLEIARAGTAAHVETMVRLWRRADRLDAEARREAEQLRHESRGLTLFPDEDGMWVVRGRLPAEVGAVLEKALEVAEEELFRTERFGSNKAAEQGTGATVSERGADASRGCPSEVHGDEASSTQRRADALGLVAETALDRGSDGRCRCAESDSAERGRLRGAVFSMGRLPEVVVHVDAEALEAASDRGHAVLEQGVRVSAETSRRLSSTLVAHGHSIGPETSLPSWGGESVDWAWAIEGLRSSSAGS